MFVCGLFGCFYYKITSFPLSLHPRRSLSSSLGVSAQIQGPVCVSLRSYIPVLCALHWAWADTCACVASCSRRTALLQQAQGESLGSGTLLLLGALCESVVLSPIIQLVSCHNAFFQFSDWEVQSYATALLPKKYYIMLTCDWAPGLMTAGLPILSQPWLVWYKSTRSKKSYCEPTDLNRFVVEDLRERHLEFWTHYSDGCPREHNSIILTYL
jgi:hypothetical protein